MGGLFRGVQQLFQSVVNVMNGAQSLPLVCRQGNGPLLMPLAWQGGAQVHLARCDFQGFFSHPLDDLATVSHASFFNSLQEPLPGRVQRFAQALSHILAYASATALHVGDVLHGHAHQLG